MIRNFIILMASAIPGTSCMKDAYQAGEPADILASKLVGRTDCEALGGSLLVKLNIQNDADPAVLFEDLEVTGVKPALKVQPKNLEAARATRP